MMDMKMLMLITNAAIGVHCLLRCKLAKASTLPAHWINCHRLHKGHQTLRDRPVLGIRNPVGSACLEVSPKMAPSSLMEF